MIGISMNQILQKEWFKEVDKILNMINIFYLDCIKFKVKEMSFQVKTHNQIIKQKCIFFYKKLIQ